MKVKYLLFVFLLIQLSCNCSEKSHNREVLPGAYNLGAYIPILKGKTISIVANHASKINGVHIVDTLTSLNESIKIKSIFSPEHGFSGTYDAGKIIDNEEHEYSFSITSLYGKKKKPSAVDMEGVDFVLFDLQDVGVRFYTYISTLHYVMLSCAENNVPLIVLDRPNPHCSYFDGPVLEPEFKSFVGMHPVPIVYGMTIGEYAQMINEEGWLGNGLKCELTIINITNFERTPDYVFEFKPSPNLPNMRSVYLYPSLCLFEGTIMSVGRGTEFPFQAYGHPELDETTFSFMPRRMEGASSNPKHKNLKCNGIDLRRIDIDSLKAQDRINLNYIVDSYGKLGNKTTFFNDYFNLLAGTDKLKIDIMAGKSEDEIRKSWKSGLEMFKEIREKYLLYAPVD